MAKRVQQRRGTPADHLTFTTGAAGEVTVELPTTRGTGASQQFAALYVHHGDNAVGDRIPSANELVNTTRSTVDEQRFLAKLTGFRPINDDGSIADPDILPSRWEYKWEEVSLSGGAANVQQQVVIVISGSSSGAATKTITLPTNIYGSTKSLNIVMGNGDNRNVTAEKIRTAINNDADVLYNADTVDPSSPSPTVTLRAVDGSNNVVYGPIKVPTTTVSDLQGVAITTTPGKKYVEITGGTGDLNRKSNPAGDNNHTFAAINISELQNTANFVAPGMGDGTNPITVQTANGPFPANYKVVPIGGTATYSGNPSEPVTTANTSAPFFRDTAVNMIVEMTERRKLVPGTGAGQTVGAPNTDGVNVFYYFQMPNAIVGPC
jgi:hypothetical protein